MCRQHYTDVSRYNILFIYINIDKRRKKRSTEIEIVEQRIQQSILTIPGDYLAEGTFYEVILIASQNLSELYGKMYYMFNVDFRPRGGICSSDIAEG